MVFSTLAENGVNGRSAYFPVTGSIKTVIEFVMFPKETSKLQSDGSVSESLAVADNPRRWVFGGTILSRLILRTWLMWVAITFFSIRSIERSLQSNLKSVSVIA